MPGDASDSSEDSDTQTNEKACTVKHQITNGKSLILQTERTHITVHGEIKITLCNGRICYYMEKAVAFKHYQAVQICQLMTVGVYVQLINVTINTKYLQTKHTHCPFAL